MLTTSKVTIALATMRGFPWKKVPIYILAQLLGSLCGAGVVYATYYHQINIVEGGSNIRTVALTGGLFATYAVSSSLLGMSYSRLYASRQITLHQPLLSSLK
jgi:glycerol uptake facilitator-like aquaporin